jgi:hypothetical protein
MITYATLPQMTKAEKEKTRSELIAYCRQDTWAMVEIARALWNLSNPTEPHHYASQLILIQR